VDAAVVAQLRAAAAAGRATRCIYEAGNSACQERQGVMALFIYIYILCMIYFDLSINQ
jgi:NADH:ubiquinone oxidoreductase subunit 3 (subunit A)